MTSVTASRLRIVADSFDAEAEPSSSDGTDALSAHDHTMHLDITRRVSCTQTGWQLYTPMKAAAWRLCLTNYPDSAWAHRLIHDIIYGVDIGYRGSRHVRVSCPNFVKAGAEHRAVTVSLTDDATANRIIGPFTSTPFPFFRCSPLKTVEKRGSPGTYRIIHHLSHPHNRSINSSTADRPCRLSRFEQAADIVRRLGRGCFICKVDIKAAYRAVPIRPVDWPMLGMIWENRYWFHTTLPFGLRSSCHLWERYATAAQWMAQHRLGSHLILHYLDDFFIAAAQHQRCQRDLNNFQFLLSHLGLPEAMDKTVAPTNRLIFLGIFIDTNAMTVSLDQERLDRITVLLTEWERRQNCSLRQLQSLVGTLSWASQVVRHGRIFLQHMRDLIRHASQADDAAPSRPSISLTSDFRDDLSWWLRFMASWNGVSLLAESDWLDPAKIAHVYTDACVDGFAAVTGTQWFQRRWTDEQEAAARDSDMARDSMPWKELYAIVAAAATWGPLWSRQRVLFWTDCQPVVQALDKGASRTRRMMQLIRALHFYAARHSFSYWLQHIAGADNAIADELSRVHDASQLSQACRSAIDRSPIIPALPTVTS